MSGVFHQSPPNNELTHSHRRLLFLSHSTEDYSIAVEVATVFDALLFDTFMAHRDLETGVEWIREIKSKLADADLFVALFSPAFRTSLWTDQEVGMALSLHKSIITLAYGAPPYGFVGGHQGLRWGIESAEGSNRSFDGGRRWSGRQRSDRLVRIGRALDFLGLTSSIHIVSCLIESRSSEVSDGLVGILKAFSVRWARSHEVRDFEKGTLAKLAKVASTNPNLYNSADFVRFFRPLFTEIRDGLSSALARDLALVDLLRA